MTREEKIELLEKEKAYMLGHGGERQAIALDAAIKALQQESKIKVLDRDEVARKLGAVDIYGIRTWATLLKDLEYLGLKICEVEE